MLEHADDLLRQSVDFCYCSLPCKFGRYAAAWKHCSPEFCFEEAIALAHPVDIPCPFRPPPRLTCAFGHALPVSVSPVLELCVRIESRV